MYVRLKSKATLQEINVIITNIVSFEPTADLKDTALKLTNGEQIVVGESCRSIRHAIKAVMCPATVDNSAD